MSDDYETDATSVTTSGSSSYVLVQQTSYDGGSDATYPGTYLQLGAYPTWGDSTQRGDNLLALIGLDASTEYFFKDDHRYKNGFQHSGTTYTRADGNATTSSTPSTLTKELLTRGGIRLHTDGNYVSTTRGNRVDVVFGNYHLAVLGRTDGSSTATVWRPAYWESSGGHTVGDDVARRARQEIVAWNDDTEAWRTYVNTLKGNHTVRFEGPLEHVYECQSYEETIGAASDADVGGTIPATSAEPHQQTDQAANWVNPSSGFTSSTSGGDWPRTRETPDLTETIHAGSHGEKTAVHASFGAASSGATAAGSIARTRTVNDKATRARTSSHGKIVDTIHTSTGKWYAAGSGAKVVEKRGAKVVDETKRDKESVLPDVVWSFRCFGGQYIGSESLVRNELAAYYEHGFDQRYHVVGIDFQLHIGLELQTTNHEREEFDYPAVFSGPWARTNYYAKDRWAYDSTESEDSIDDVVWFAGRVGDAVGFQGYGTGETHIQMVGTLRYGSCTGGRVGLRLGQAGFVAWDHVEAAPIASHTDYGLFKFIAALREEKTHALEFKTRAVDVRLSVQYVES